jgi:transcriptional regulator with XRE-family HTH domain
VELNWSKPPLGIAGDIVKAKRLALGLRQRDLADRVPTSVTTVSWLEQGRDFSLSDQLFQSFCTALECNAMEKAFLIGLRRHQPHEIEPTTSGRFWQPFVEPVTGPPLLLTNRCWDVLVRSDPANNEFAALTTNKPTFHLLEQLLTVTNPIQDLVFLNRQIDQFRIDSIRHLGQPAHTNIVKRLATISNAFARRWCSTEFSPDSDRSPEFTLGRLKLKVERMHDHDRSLILHLFHVSGGAE